MGGNPEFNSNFTFFAVKLLVAKQAVYFGLSVKDYESRHWIIFFGNKAMHLIWLSRKFHMIITIWS